MAGRAKNPNRKKAARPPKDWKERFLGFLSETGVVTDSCRRAGVHYTTAYAHQKTDANFAAAWEVAIENACDDMELEARRRGVVGTDKPVFQGGKRVGKIREYSDTLLIFMLKANRPEKFRDGYKLDQLIDAINRNGLPQPPAGDKATG